MNLSDIELTGISPTGNAATSLLPRGLRFWLAQPFQRCHNLLRKAPASAAAGAKHLLKDTRASQVAEAAMVLPLMFTILLSIFWFGRAYNVYATISRAAQEGASLAATSTCGSCGNALIDAMQVGTAVNSALQASKLDPAQVAENPMSGLSQCDGYIAEKQGNIDIYRNVQLNPTSTGPKQCGVIVTFRYPYQFYLPFTSLNNQRINMTAAAERQMEN